MSEPDVRRDFATEVVSRLRAAGHQALWAGGCVRDLLMGHVPADFDVATDATPERVMDLFPRTVPVGVSFGVVRVLGPKGAGEVEVATFRSDGRYLDGRRPESVTFGSPREDASRRDFTINGMFLDPISGEVLDYVGGRDDLRAGVLRSIGDASARFAEDKLRLLRAVRFAARFEFHIEERTRAALALMADQVRAVAAERIAQELKRMLVHQSRVRAMNLGFDMGLIHAILPQLVAMKGLPQHKPVQPDGDLWDHTMQVLHYLPEAPSFALAFAALLHDVGKPLTKGLKEGRTTYLNHEVVGRRISDEICRGLKLANAEREQICWLVEYHQYLGQANELRVSKLKPVLAMPGIEDLLALHRADALASTGDISHVEYCEWYLRDQPAGEINPPPLITGRDLAGLGLPPGPRYAELLKLVREAQLDGIVNSKKEAIEWLQRIPSEEHDEPKEI